MFKEVDIIAELSKERELQKSGADAFLRQASQILTSEWEHENQIQIRLKGDAEEFANLSVDQLGSLDSSLVFDQHVIMQIATKYRLRFLDSKLFADDIPYEATAKVKALEQKVGHQFQQFRILAPASRFQLKDATEDPILFADLGNGEYYMIHKWGNDMVWFRNIQNFPMRNITTLGLTSVIIGLMITLLLPNSLFPAAEWESSFANGLTRIYLSFIFSGFIFVTALIVGILYSKEFSEDVWNSKYFN